MEAIGRVGLAVVADARKRDQAKQVVREAIARFGKLDILVNNVGGVFNRNGDSAHDPFQHDDDVFVDNLTLNLTSAYWTAREALPHMRERGYGRIINIGSGASKGTTPAPLSYHAAKHGLVGLTRALAAATASAGITVNCLCPGPTNTDLLVAGRRAARAVMRDDVHTQPDAIPPNLQRRNLEPDELGPMAALLASPQSAGITGQVISVDGGYKV